MKSNKAQSQWKLIAGHYREKIISGVLPVGSRLPNTQQIAEDFKTSVFCVQFAIRALVHEGLVSRRPRYGTVVIKQLPELKIVGIPLFLNKVLGLNYFLHLLQMDICKKLRDQHIECISLLEDYDDPNAVENLKKEINLLGIQALIHFPSSPTIAKMLKTLNLPVITMDMYIKSEYNVKRKPTFDNFLDLACKAAAEQKAIHPAMITAEYIRTPNPQGNIYLKDLRSALRTSHLKMPMERIISREEPVPYSQAELNAFSRAAFHELWNRSVKPDVLIVYTDELIPGIVLAAAEAGVRIPQDLKIIFHRNRQIEHLIPFSYTGIELDIESFAKAYVNALLAVFNHKKIQPTEILYKIKHYDVSPNNTNKPETKIQRSKKK